MEEVFFRKFASFLSGQIGWKTPWRFRFFSVLGVQPLLGGGFFVFFFLFPPSGKMGDRFFPPLFKRAKERRDAWGPHPSFPPQKDKRFAESSLSFVPQKKGIGKVFPPFVDRVGIPGKLVHFFDYTLSARCLLFLLIICQDSNRLLPPPRKRTRQPPAPTPLSNFSLH